jgi:hypothetical protein
MSWPRYEPNTSGIQYHVTTTEIFRTEDNIQTDYKQAGWNGADYRGICAMKQIYSLFSYHLLIYRRQFGSSSVTKNKY